MAALPEGYDAMLTPGEVARIFNVSQKTVERWSDEGKLGCIRTPGGHRRYRKPDVDRLLEPQADN